MLLCLRAVPRDAGAGTHLGCRATLRRARLVDLGAGGLAAVTVSGRRFHRLNSCRWRAAAGDKTGRGSGVALWSALLALLPQAAQLRAAARSACCPGPSWLPWGPSPRRSHNVAAAVIVVSKLGHAVQRQGTARWPSKATHSAAAAPGTRCLSRSRALAPGCSQRIPPSTRRRPAPAAAACAHTLRRGHAERLLDCAGEQHGQAAASGGWAMCLRRNALFNSPCPCWREGLQVQERGHPAGPCAARRRGTQCLRQV